MIFDHIAKTIRGHEELWKVFWIWGAAGNLLFASVLYFKRHIFFYHFSHYFLSWQNSYIFLTLLFTWYFIFSAVLIRRNIYNTIHEAAAEHFRIALTGFFVLGVALIAIVFGILCEPEFYQFVVYTWKILFLPVIGGLGLISFLKAVEGFSKF